MAIIEARRRNIRRGFWSRDAALEWIKTSKHVKADDKVRVFQEDTSRLDRGRWAVEIMGPGTPKRLRPIGVDPRSE